MRTTITIDDQTLAALRDKAHRTGRPLKQVVNEALSLGLREMDRPAAKPYRLKPASMGRVRAGIDLDKALALADALEEQAVLSKLETRK